MRRTGQGVRLQVAPRVFDRIQVERVGGEEVSLRIVPDNNELPGKASAVGIQSTHSSRPRFVHFAI